MPKTTIPSVDQRAVESFLLDVLPNMSATSREELRSAVKIAREEYATDKAASRDWLTVLEQAESMSEFSWRRQYAD